MAYIKEVDIGPVALTTTLTTNIFNLTVTSLAGPVGITLTQPYATLTHIAIVNKTASAATFSLYRGATGANAAGTEFIGTATTVAANTTFHWYGRARFDSTSFLVGGSPTATALTLQGELELAFS